MLNQYHPIYWRMGSSTSSTLVYVHRTTKYDVSHRQKGLQIWNSLSLLGSREKYAESGKYTASWVQADLLAGTKRSREWPANLYCHFPIGSMEYSTPNLLGLACLQSQIEGDKWSLEGREPRVMKTRRWAVREKREDPQNVRVFALIRGGMTPGGGPSLFGPLPVPNRIVQTHSNNLLSLDIRLYYSHVNSRT